jgi:hypothetical protein
LSEQEILQTIYDLKEKVSDLRVEHWFKYSNWETWYFWFNIMSIIIPLSILYFKIDRKRLFEICFFGFIVHVTWSNIDSILSSNNYLIHPHGFTHFFPIGITVTAVVIPVFFMLLYQYCTNRGKNFYLYTIILSALIAYGFGYWSKTVELLKMYKGMKLTHLFVIDITVAYVAYWVTKLFVRIKNATSKES